jgi:hypothetical protein
MTLPLPSQAPDHLGHIILGVLCLLVGAVVAVQAYLNYQRGFLYLRTGGLCFKKIFKREHPMGFRVLLCINVLLVVVFLVFAFISFFT